MLMLFTADFQDLGVPTQWPELVQVVIITSVAVDVRHPLPPIIQLFQIRRKLQIATG